MTPPWRPFERPQTQCSSQMRGDALRFPLGVVGRASAFHECAWDSKGGRQGRHATPHGTRPRARLETTPARAGGARRRHSCALMLAGNGLVRPIPGAHGSRSVGRTDQSFCLHSIVYRPIRGVLGEPPPEPRPSAIRRRLCASPLFLISELLHRVRIDAVGDRFADGVADCNGAGVVDPAPDAGAVPIGPRLRDAGVRLSRHA
jgi:hypothetical protein